MLRRAEDLRIVAARLNLPSLRDVVRQPGVGEAFRLTILYHDTRYPNQVATLTHALDESVLLNVAYHSNPPSQRRHNIGLPRYRLLDKALRRLNFERLDDQPDLPLAGVDLWLVEHVRGTYARDAVIAPAMASGVYADLWEVLLMHLGEAVQPLR